MSGQFGEEAWVDIRYPRSVETVDGLQTRNTGVGERLGHKHHRHSGSCEVYVSCVS